MAEVAGGKIPGKIEWVDGVLWRLCTECRICDEVCVAEAISFRNGAAVIDRDKCGGCNECYYHCPQHCIDPQKVLG